MTSEKVTREHRTNSGQIGERTANVAFRLYKSLVSPLMHTVSPSRCVYLPTCSEYSYTAVSRFGLLRGSLMALQRLLRCHPLAKGGLDPVPERTPAGVPRASSFNSSRPNEKSTNHLP